MEKAIQVEGLQKSYQKLHVLLMFAGIKVIVVNKNIK